jgi:hypothetical protein
MATIGGTSQLSAGFNQTVSSGVITSQTIPASISLTTQYGNGTGAGQVDLIYAKQLTLAATPTTLDLTAVTDLSGASVNFARVREMAIQIVDKTAGHNVTLGNAATNAFSAFWGATGTDVVFAGSIRYFTDPTSTGAGVGAIVDSTHKNLKLDPGANTVVINILVVGCSAV